jgi:hypothetical protein
MGIPQNAQAPALRAGLRGLWNAKLYPLGGFVGLAAVLGALLWGTPAGGQQPANIFTAAREAVANGDFKKTPMLGFSIINTPFIEVPADGAILVGFDIGLGTNRKPADVIYAIRPLYLSSKGEAYFHDFGSFEPDVKRANGQVQKGITHTVRLKAKPGYAVGGIVMRRAIEIRALAVTFHRIDGMLLDRRQAYTTPWVGDSHDGTPGSLNTNGAPVVGVFGNSSNNRVIALGLVSMNPSAAAALAPPPRIQPLPNPGDPPAAPLRGNKKPLADLLQKLQQQHQPPPLRPAPLGNQDPKKKEQAKAPKGEPDKPEETEEPEASEPAVTGLSTFVVVGVFTGATVVLLAGALGFVSWRRALAAARRREEEDWLMGKGDPPDRPVTNGTAPANPLSGGGDLPAAPRTALSEKRPTPPPLPGGWSGDQRGGPEAEPSELPSVLPVVRSAAHADPLAVALPLPSGARTGIRDSLPVPPPLPDRWGKQPQSDSARQPVPDVQLRGRAEYFLGIVSGGGLGMNRLYRIYLLPDRLLFLEMGNTGPDALQVGLMAGGGLIGGLIGAAVAQHRHDKLKSRRYELDVCDVQELIHRALAGKEGFLFKPAELKNAVLEAPGPWAAVLMYDRQTGGWLSFEHPEAGKFCITIRGQDEMRKAVKFLPELFGDQLAIRAIYNYRKERFLRPA